MINSDVARSFLMAKFREERKMMMSLPLLHSKNKVRIFCCYSVIQEHYKRKQILFVESLFGDREEVIMRKGKRG